MSLPEVTYIKLFAKRMIEIDQTLVVKHSNALHSLKWWQVGR